jgi:hypothetical protein
VLDFLGSLAFRRTMDPKNPLGMVLTYLGGCQPSVVAVVPFLQVITSVRFIAITSDAASVSTARCNGLGEDQLERAALELPAKRLRLSATLRSKSSLMLVWRPLLDHSISA